MIKIENEEVVGWEHTLRGMRNPKNSWDKSDSEYVYCEYDGEWQPKVEIGPNDHDLMTRLRNAGTDHRKYLRMIVVYIDIVAPLYWWKEFDTYKVGTVANSCSTMHKIHEKEFTLEDFSTEHLCEINADDLSLIMDVGDYYAHRFEIDYVISDLNLARKLFLAADQKSKRDDLTDAEKKHVLAQRKKFWWQMIQLLPSSYNQRRTIKLNYEVLANIYKSRRGHKLDEWREFCKWIESLPYSELITGVEKKGE
jgi:hypothetical protein